jgi:hypothetical protein
VRVYVDIDGVLLANEEHPALYADELIQYLADYHEPYWLTTHCRGDAIPTQQHLARLFADQKTLRALGKFKATNWQTWKTEAIDFGQSFVWLDDDLFSEEKAELVSRGAMENFIEIDLMSNPGQLKEVIALLKQKKFV